MKFKPGDKVKFLNEKGGGVVTKIISPSMVNVMIEEGFEIPTMTSEIIRVGSSEKGSGMFEEDFNVEVAPETEEQMEGNGEDLPEGIIALRDLSFRTKTEPGIYLAYVPHDQKWLVTGPVDIFLVNHSSFDIIYSLFLKDKEGRYAGKDYDIIPPSSRKLVATAEREELEGWLSGIVQLLIHQDNPEVVHMPVSSTFKVKAVRLTREEEHKESAFMEERAVIIALTTVAGIEPAIIQKDKGSPSDQTASRKAEPVRQKSLIDRFATGPKEAVVDLHIEEITDDHKKMVGHEILNYQLAHFNRVLESAIAENYHKVTFIHGVGNGTLKSALIKRLKEYENLENHSASLAKFGVGAIDVVIRPLK